MSASFSLAGAHLKVYVNSQLLGYVTGVPSWSIQSSWARLQEIDSISTRELAPRAYAVDGSIQILRGRATGGAEGAGMVASAKNTLRQKYCNIEIQDIITGDLVFQAIKCQIVNQSWRIDPKGLVMGVLNFVGIDFHTEDDEG